MLLEVQVHALLKAYLREHRDIDWPHHLTIARLVARGLRIGRSSLIQTGTEVERYSLSYLIPALLTTENILLVVPEAWQVKLLEQDIPHLQNWLKEHQSEVELSQSKLMITSFPNWLSDRLNHLGHFPDSLPTVIIQAEDLETWSRQQLTLDLTPQDWLEQLQQANSQQHNITTVKVKITQNLYQHPPNPYGCYALDESIQIELESLWDNLGSLGLLSPVMERFWRQWQQGEQIFWASLQRETGQFHLFLAPHSVAGYLSQIWTRQPVVIMGQFIDKQITATLGLEDILQLNFAPDAQRELIQLYSPARFPFPNTPEFQFALYREINKLITNQGLVILVDDLPLKGQLAAILASEYGSRVQVETQDLPTNGILISGWEFWCEQAEPFWSPELLIMVTLPLPSLEHPVVASRVNYYKQKRQDWFRGYLLPTALNKMQKAIVPLRNSQGTLVILDNRVNYRSYGDDIIKALEPCARINNLS
ncbi:MAG: ATP-dependent DNA helicase [Gloeocapsa sp. DLM2.Bin57]|nr:MAG: ATP-dependent DNA helicase [Gloeocapsa sp. DLM2.Bin57]